jgi:hypothetical protein
MRQSATQPRRLSNHPRLNTAWNALLWISVIALARNGSGRPRGSDRGPQGRDAQTRGAGSALSRTTVRQVF